MALEDSIRLRAMLLSIRDQMMVNLLSWSSGGENTRIECSQEDFRRAFQAATEVELGRLSQRDNPDSLGPSTL